MIESSCCRDREDEEFGDVAFPSEARYSYEQAARIERRWQGIISLLLAALVGLIAFALTALVAEKLRPPVGAPAVGLLVGIIIVQMALVREAVLFVWVASITYYRNYFIYSHPDEAQGLYWIPSDIPWSCSLSSG